MNKKIVFKNLILNIQKECAFAHSCFRPFVPSPFRAFALSCLFVLLLTGCKQRNRFAIDVNKHRVEVNINRFDKALISLDTTRMHDEVVRLYQEYPDFFPVFISNVMHLNPSDTLQVVEKLRFFLTYEDVVVTNRAVLDKFSNIRDIERSISTAFTYIRYYFPEVRLPEIYFFVSAIDRQVIMTDKFIAVGVDMYLGSDFSLYQYYIPYRYLLNSMNRENLAPDLVSALLFRSFPMRSSHNRLIDNMLHRGKIMFLLSIFKPDVKDEHLIGYTTEQIRWCRRYERNIWAAIIDQKDLFSTDRFIIGEYVNEAPFVNRISPDSPGRLGTWVGWQIVRSYMQRNQHATLRDLVNTTDYQQLLENSGYRP